MLVTEIYDGQGLGNQLWCYVVTRVLAADKGVGFGILAPENLKCNDFMRLDFGTYTRNGKGPEGGPPQTLPEGIPHYYKERVLRHPVTGEDISTEDPALLNVPDGTKIDGTMQSERYIAHRKDEIRNWLKVRDEFECDDFADDTTCIINFRGGEYVHISNVFLPKRYWEDAVAHMRKVRPNMRFVVVTDDVETARTFFPDFPIHHFGIAKDFVVVKNAHYLILANTSFAWFPAWLNERCRLCIAPRYWWAHNHSDGYWSCGFNLTSGWMYLDRDGNLVDSETCRREFEAYRANHRAYYEATPIRSNFLVVSDYNNDVSWVPERTTNYVIYNRSDSDVLPYTVDPSKVVRSPNLGYNIYDYCTYIINHYDALPEVMAFVKGNVFPRHVSRTFFDRISNNAEFAAIVDSRRHATKFPVSYFDGDGIFNEINNSWYMWQHPRKYFSTFNDFLQFAFEDPPLPRYTRFAPGANYIVPRSSVRKLSKAFYENVRTFVSHDPLPAEAHLIERALYTIWNSDLQPRTAMEKPLTAVELPSVSMSSQNLAERLRNRLRSMLFKRGA